MNTVLTIAAQFCNGGAGMEPIFSTGQGMRIPNRPGVTRRLSRLGKHSTLIDKEGPAR